MTTHNTSLLPLLLFFCDTALYYTRAHGDDLKPLQTTADSTWDELRRDMFVSHHDDAIIYWRELPLPLQDAERMVSWVACEADGGFTLEIGEARSCALRRAGVCMWRAESARDKTPGLMVQLSAPVLIVLFEGEPHKRGRCQDRPRRQYAQQRERQTDRQTNRYRQRDRETGKNRSQR